MPEDEDVKAKKRAAKSRPRKFIMEITVYEQGQRGTEGLTSSVAVREEDVEGSACSMQIDLRGIYAVRNALMMGGNFVRQLYANKQREMFVKENPNGRRRKKTEEPTEEKLGLITAPIGGTEGPLFNGDAPTAEQSNTLASGDDIPDWVLSKKK